MYVLFVCVDCQIFHYDLDTNMFLTLADRKNTTNQHNQSITANTPLLMSLSVCMHAHTQTTYAFSILSTTTIASRKMLLYFAFPYIFFHENTYHYIKKEKKVCNLLPIHQITETHQKKKLHARLQISKNKVVDKKKVREG